MTSGIHRADLRAALAVEFARTPPVAVDIALPPTLEQLRRRLREMPHPNVRVAIQHTEDHPEGER